MCGVIVVDAESFRSLDTDVMPIFHNHCLRYRHNFALFYQLLDSNFFTHSILLCWEKPLVKPVVPGSIFHHISFRSTILQSFSFRSINQKPQKYLLYLLFSFIYLYQISLLQVTMKGLTTPLSRWVICALSPTGLIPWFSIWGKYLSLRCCITLSSSREKPTQAQEVAVWRFRRSNLEQVTYQQTKGITYVVIMVRPIKIFVEYVGTNMSIQVLLLVIDRRYVSVMST